MHIYEEYIYMLIYIYCTYVHLLYILYIYYIYYFIIHKHRG